MNGILFAGTLNLPLSFAHMHMYAMMGKRPRTNAHAGSAAAAVTIHITACMTQTSCIVEILSFAW